MVTQVAFEKNYLKQLNKKLLNFIKIISALNLAHDFELSRFSQIR